MPGHRYTPEQVTQWAFMYQKGTPIVQIAKESGASVPTVIRHLKEMGVSVMEDFEQEDEGKSQGAQKEPEKKRDVVLILTFNEKGQMLFGKRQRSGKWAVPGGHIKKGEYPVQTASRELFEETGLRPLGGTLSQVYNRPGLYVFKAKVSGVPTPAYDPDHEFTEFNWENVAKGLPEGLAQKLDPPADGSPNVLFHLFDGLKKGGLQKSEDLEAFDSYFQDENPKVRAMALKFLDLTNDHICRCMGDPDYEVVKAALQHPLCTSDHISQFLSRPDLENFLDDVLGIKDHPLFNQDHSAKLANTFSAYSDVQVKKILAKVLDNISVPHDIISALLNRMQK